MVHILLSCILRGLTCNSSIPNTASTNISAHSVICTGSQLIKPFRSQEHHRHFLQGYSALAG